MALKPLPQHIDPATEAAALKQLLAAVIWRLSETDPKAVAVISADLAARSLPDEVKTFIDEFLSAAVAR